MKKYRILKRTLKYGGVTYVVQKRWWLVFWVDERCGILELASAKACIEVLKYGDSKPRVRDEVVG